MKKTLTYPAYAKINLFLRVTGRRDDGYHEIESLMQSVSLSDYVTVTADTDAHGQEIDLTCTEPSVPCDRHNIAAKCAELFFSHFGIENYSVSIHIEKHIPVSGGLAGGSTDGAAVLRILNELYRTNAKTETLCSLGEKIGADIPFCIVGGTAKCEGIGEKITPLVIPKPSYSVLIVSPGGHVSTPDAYRAIDENGEITPKHTLSEAAIELCGGRLPRSLHNDFESVILPHNERATFVKQMLTDSGADAVQMSGSGPTLFALFESEEKCRSAAEKTEKSGFSAYVCHMI